MKKFLSLLLTLCLLLGILPSQALAYVGDILPSTGSTVTTETRADGTLVLQNDYIRVTLNKHDGSLTTSPAATADSANSIDRQKPYCEFIIYGSYGYGKAHPATLRLKSAEFVDTTPNGTAKAIKAVYDLTVNLSGKSVAATTAVYYELVQLKENETSADTWGVLTSIDNIKINNNRDDLFGSLTGDMGVIWGYTLDAFSGMGHANATDGPAIKMSRTVYNYDEQVEISTESSVLTSKVENLDTWQSFSQGTDWCYNYITEVYVDGYTWANPFVGLSGYYENKTIKAYLPDTVSVTPGSNPNSTRVECRNDIGYYFSDGEDYPNSQRFLWGFRNLAKGAEDVPSEPDKVDISINAQRLAAFANGNGGVTVEYVADDAALDALKKQYGNPVALISGEYESKNGTDFTFTGGAALLSPSVTATWDKSNGKLIIKKDGTIEHSGLSLNAPSFKFYQPNSGSGKDLEIKLTQDGFSFEIDPGKNDAVIYVDIPYATAKLENQIAAITQKKAETIRVAAYASLAMHWMPEILYRFRRVCPDTDVDLRMVDHELEPFELLEEGRTDVIFAARQSHVNCDWTPLYNDIMYAILPEDYPTGGRDSFPIEEFDGKEFLMPYGRFDIDVNAALSPKGVRPQIRPCHVDDETVIRMVSKGLGVSMMTEIMMRGRTQGVQTLPVTPRAGRELGMGMPLRKNMPEEVLRLRDCVLDFIHEL